MTLILPITLPPTGDTKNSRIRTQLFDIQNYLNSGAIGIVGTITNDNAAAGDIGESVRSFVDNPSAISSTGSTNYFDITSISLTAGDWDITGIFGFITNGATVTVSRGGISTTSGNSSTGLSFGDNAIDCPIPGANNSTGTISAYRQSLASPATIYLKAMLTFTVATPKAYGRISARRAR